MATVDPTVIVKSANCVFNESVRLFSLVLSIPTAIITSVFQTVCKMGLCVVKRIHRPMRDATTQRIVLSAYTLEERARGIWLRAPIGKLIVWCRIVLRFQHIVRK